MANVQDLDDSFAYPIEDLVRVTSDEQDPNIGIICSISTERLFAKLGHRFPDALRSQSALSDTPECVLDLRTPPGCIEPSSLVALVSLCDRLVRDELSAIGLGQPPADGGLFIIGHGVDTGAPSFDFTGIFREIVLVLHGPAGDVLQHLSQSLGCHLETMPCRRRLLQTNPL
jgi:hypothetical protein